MRRSTQDLGRKLADGSILDAIPAPDEIREQMIRNAEENRVLRSLYRLSRRLADRKRQAAEQRPGVSHADA